MTRYTPTHVTKQLRKASLAEKANEEQIKVLFGILVGGEGSMDHLNI
jgi:hypothetical protein